MSDSRSLPGNTRHDVTPLHLNDHTAAEISVEAETLEGFPSERENAEHAVEQEPARSTPNKPSIFAFDVNARISPAPVAPDSVQAASRRRRSVLRQSLDQSARRARSLAVAAGSHLAVVVKLRLPLIAARVSAQVRLLIRSLATATDSAVITIDAAHRRIGRVSYPRPLTAVVMVSLIAIAVTFEWRSGMNASLATQPATSVATLAAIEPVALPLIGGRAVTPLERLRSAIAPMAPNPGSRSRPARRTAASPDNARAIQVVLNRYRDALSILDVAAVRAVWPSVDVAAVRSGFARVVEQNVEFDGCRISSAGARATASCAGVLESGLNPGQRRPRSERKRWQFTLQKSGDRWRITNVSATALNGNARERSQAAR